MPRPRHSVFPSVHKSCGTVRCAKRSPPVNSPRDVRATILSPGPRSRAYKMSWLKKMDGGGGLVWFPPVNQITKQKTMPYKMLAPSAFSRSQSQYLFINFCHIKGWLGNISSLCISHFPRKHWKSVFPISETIAVFVWKKMTETKKITVNISKYKFCNQSSLFSNQLKDVRPGLWTG